MSKSEIGKQIFPQYYEDIMVPLLPDVCKYIVDFEDPALTPDMWDDKLTELFDAYNLYLLTL